MVCIYIDGKNTVVDALMSRGAPAWPQSDGDILHILGIPYLPSKDKTRKHGYSCFKNGSDQASKIFMKIWATKIVQSIAEEDSKTLSESRFS